MEVLYMTAKEIFLCLGYKERKMEPGWLGYKSVVRYEKTVFDDLAVDEEAEGYSWQDCTFLHIIEFKEKLDGKTVVSCWGIDKYNKTSASDFPFELNLLEAKAVAMQLAELGWTADSLLEG